MQFNAEGSHTTPHALRELVKRKARARTSKSRATSSRRRQRGYGFVTLAIFGFGLSLPLLVALAFSSAQRLLNATAIAPQPQAAPRRASFNLLWISTIIPFRCDGKEFSPTWAASIRDERVLGCAKQHVEPAAVLNRGDSARSRSITPIAQSEPLAPFPAKWNHFADKKLRQSSILEHVFTGKVCTLFRNML